MSVGTAAATLLLSALVEASVLIQLHTDAPGEDGTENVAENAEHAPVVFSDPAGLSITSNADVTWGDVPESETYSHATLWTDDGDWLTGGELPTPFDVDAGDDFTLPAGSIVVVLA